MDTTPLNEQVIAVIGANGMLGSMLLQHLPDSTIAATRDDIDIANIESVQNFFMKHTPDILINAAAYTTVDDCEDNVATAQAVNAVGPENLAKLCKANGVTLVHYSTDYVFNGEQQSGYDEAYTDIDPVNAYGASKAAGEQAIQALADDTWNNYYIVRTAWLYGPGGNNFVETMLTLAQDRDELSVVNDQHGSPTYTHDLASHTIELLTGDYAGGVYHVTNSGSCTWFEFASEIFKQAEVDITVTPCTTEEFPRPAKRPQFSILHNTKLPAIRSWQDGLAAYLQER